MNKKGLTNLKKVRFILFVLVLFSILIIPAYATENVEKETPLLEEFSWENTLFIGDSLTVGMNEAVSLEDKGATVCAKVGRTISEAEDSVYNLTNYDRVVIGIGTNNYGSDSEIFANQYRELISIVKKNNPDAEIYANTIPGVNDSKAESNGYYITNSKVDSKNNIIKEIAQAEDVLCLDINEYLGNLSIDDTRDGLHLRNNVYEKWFAFMESSFIQNVEMENNEQIAMYTMLQTQTIVKRLLFLSDSLKTNKAYLTPFSYDFVKIV